MKTSIRDLIERKTGHVTVPPQTEKQQTYYDSRRGTALPKEEALMAANEPAIEQANISQGASSGTEPQGTVNMTFDQLQALMASIATNIVMELKKPTPEEAAKLATDKALLDRRRTEMVRIAREETSRLVDFQARCSHLKENGKPATGGQLYSNGHVNMFCLRCGKVVEDYIPRSNDMATGFGHVSDDFNGTGGEAQPLM